MKKLAGIKVKKSRSEPKLTAITEMAEGEEGPNEETKEVPEAEAKEEGELSEEQSLMTGVDLNLAFDSTVDYSKNTPLLWATHCGHLRVVWLLLSDGYSPSDVDKMMNNALHLAAAYGDVKILQVLINDGANANAVNYYKNKPIDMAKNKAVRDLLAVAMEVGASMTDEDRRVKHEQNLKQVMINQSTVSSSIISDRSPICL
jgi:ankyrin repeat protein